MFSIRKQPQEATRTGEVRRSQSSSQKLDEMGAGKIFPLILRYAWPAVVTMTINQLYNVVDRIYIGQGCGPDAIAGLTLTFPIMGALGAIGVLIGMGASTILSINLGAGKTDDAERALGQCVAMKLLFGFVFPPLMYFFGFRPLLAMMAGDGATQATIDLALRYLSITIFFNLFAHLGFGLSATMRAEGSPRQSMCCMVIGCLTNVILDPFFIFKSIPLGFIKDGLSLPGLGMGVEGAAWATNISMVVTCLTALSFYLSGKSVVRLRLCRIGIFKDLAPRALAIGLSPCLMQLMGAFIGFSMNHAFAKWSGSLENGTIQICALGIVNTTMFLFFIPTAGVQQGLAPIIGFNWGAENFGRVRKSLVLGLRLTALTCVVTCAAMLIFARLFSRCFASDAVVVDAASRAIRIANCMIWTIFVNVAATTYFQAVGRPRTAILLSLLRQCLCLLPIVWILPHFMDDHILAIWIAMPISDVVAQIATIPPLLKEYKMLVKKQLGDKGCVRWRKSPGTQLERG